MEHLWDKLLKIISDYYPDDLVKFVMSGKELELGTKYEQEKVIVEYQSADINFWIVDGGVKKILNIEPYSAWKNEIPALVFTRNGILTKGVDYKHEIISVVLLLEKKVHVGEYAVTCNGNVINRFVFPVVSLKNIGEILDSCLPLAPFIIKIDKTYQAQVIERLKGNNLLLAMTVLVLSHTLKISQKEAIAMTGMKLDEWRQALLEVPAMQELFEDTKLEAQIEKAKMIAKAMLAKKMDVILIAELTGLSKAEIEKLR